MTSTPWMNYARRSALAAALAVLAAATSARAAVLYDETFAGSGRRDVLHGRGPTVDQNGGSNTWVGHSGFRADGSITVPSGGSGVWLPFVPTTGMVYTLQATFTGVVGDGNWFALGFSEAVPANPQGTGNANRFISDPTNGKAWMLFRGDNSANPNQTLRGDAGSGTLAAGTLPWAGGPTGGGDVNLRVILDTTGGAGNFTARFEAKLPADVTYTDVGGGALDLNDEGIGAVGFAGSNAAIDATITRFMLDNGAGAPIVPGDVDGDGDADMADFGVIRDNLFNSVTMRSQGDLNSDGIVNFVDFRQWKTAAGGAVGAQGAVPEPGSLALAGAAVATMAARTRRRRRGGRRSRTAILQK